VDQLAAVADAAGPSGIIELTSRANLHLRGATPALLERLRAVAGRTPGGPEPLSVQLSPTAGHDPDELADLRPLAARLAGLAETLGARVTSTLPTKFGFLLDAGGSWHLRGRRHPVALARRARRDGAPGFELVVDGALPLATEPRKPRRWVAADAVEQVSAAIVEQTARYGGCDPDRLGVVEVGSHELLEAPTHRVTAPLGATAAGFGLAPVLGRFTGAQLAALVDELVATPAAAAANAGLDVRLTPWRGVLVHGLDAAAQAALATRLAGIGLVVDPADPGAWVVACAGSTGCASGFADTVADATRAVATLRATGPDTGAIAGGTGLHLSGCAKRCASRHTDEYTAVAVEGGRYELYGPSAAGIAQPLMVPSLTGPELLLEVRLVPEVRP
jgi:precorrin-3B synthase